jgi:cytochrome c2
MKFFVYKTVLILLASVLFWPSNLMALVSESRPGVPYFNEVLFLQKKLVEKGEVIIATLAYADPKDNVDLCLNRIDVFGGLEKFREIPEKRWVLVDFQLQSVLISEGFAGDADVSWVKECPDAETCMEWARQRNSDPKELARRASVPRPQATAKTDLNDIAQRLEVGRKLVRVARCRGCHSIEGKGPNHAPGLTWKRIKYKRGWLADYLQAPYRMRPAMDNLMMLRYTSPNAMPSLQPVEADAIAGYLESAAVSSAPGSYQLRELWQDYDCFDCHVRLYKANPLDFQPTNVPDQIAAAVHDSQAMSACLTCHAFGDLRTVELLPAGEPNAFAPDLLLAFEKLDLDFLDDYLKKPSRLVPQTKMPDPGLDQEQIQEIRNLAEQIKEAIEADAIKPIHIFYDIKKMTPQP